MPRKMRCFLPCVLVLMSLWLLPAQESYILPFREIPGGADREELDKLYRRTFPAALLLEAAEYAETCCWQPDWPADFPPDAFMPLTDGWSSVTVNYGGYNYTLKRGKDHLLEFPWFFEGKLVQVRLGYSSDDEPLLSRIELGGFISVDVLEYIDSELYLLRVYRDDWYFFVYLQHTTGKIYESWFDQDGVFLEQFEYTRLGSDWPDRIIQYSLFSSGEEFSRSYDSRFLITGIFGINDEFTVSYFKERYPKYLEQFRGTWFWENGYTEGSPPELLPGETEPFGPGFYHYSYQWDENGFLVRLSGERESWWYRDWRYEYTLDEKGNWIRRDEFRMLRYRTEGSGDGEWLLVPEPGTAITRVLEYDYE